MQRKFAPSTVLGEEQNHEVHRLSMRILSEIGLTFNAKSAWDTLEANGCAVDRAPKRGRNSWRRMNLRRPMTRFALNSSTTSPDTRPRSAPQRSPDRSDGSGGSATHELVVQLRAQSRIGADSVRELSA